MRTIDLPQDRRITWERVRVPRETPVGVIDSSALQVSFDGRVYQRIDPLRRYEYLDMETGEVVRIKA